MKKNIPILIVMLLVLSSIGAFGINNEEKNQESVIKEKIELSEPIIITEEDFVDIYLEEQSTSILEPGKPDLPVITKVYTFPFKTKILDLDISFKETEEILINKKVKAAAEPLVLNSNIKIPNQYEIDKNIYSSNELYPSKEYDFKCSTGLKEDKHTLYLVIKVYPIRYNPSENMISYSKEFDIEIRYEEGEQANSINDVYDMAIISPSSYESSLQSLKNHKDSHGVDTFIKTTEEIYSEYSGYDEAEKIKYFIKDAIETYGITYVLLVGSVDKMPIRTTHFHRCWHQHYWNESILTDMYYSDIYDEFGDFCTWDSNGNGKYGESFIECPGEDDIVDLYPDVHIGRLACVDNSEVSEVVSKIISYEENTYGQSWFDNIVFAGGDTFPDHGGNEGEQLNLMVEDIMSDFSSTKLWCSEGTFNFFRINQALNKGAGFFSYSGHGFPEGLGTYPPNGENMIYYSNVNILTLLNGDKLPIIFFDACLTARLDYNKSGTNIDISRPIYRILKSFLFDRIIEPISQILERLIGRLGDKETFEMLNEPEPRAEVKLIPCFAWNWIKKKNGGAIATIGATRTAFGGFDSGAGKMSLEFFSSYESSQYLGEMMTKTEIGYHEDVSYDLFTLEEFILLGDPSLKIGGYS